MVTGTCAKLGNIAALECVQKKKAESSGEDKLDPATVVFLFSGPLH